MVCVSGCGSLDEEDVKRFSYCLYFSLFLARGVKSPRVFLFCYILKKGYCWVIFPGVV